MAVIATNWHNGSAWHFSPQYALHDIVAAVLWHCMGMHLKWEGYTAWLSCLERHILLVGFRLAQANGHDLLRVK